MREAVEEWGPMRSPYIIAEMGGEFEGSGREQRITPPGKADHTQREDEGERESRMGRKSVGRGEGIRGLLAVVVEIRQGSL